MMNLIEDDEIAGFSTLENDFMKMDGYDDCIIGVVERTGLPPILCYDKTLILNKLMNDGMNEEEALEFWEYNQLGSYMGEATPCFITLEKGQENV